MTLKEVGKVSGLPLTTLKKYVADGLIRDNEYTDADLQRIGLIGTLLKMGLPTEDVKRYLDLESEDTQAAKEMQIHILRKYRGPLLDELHKRQQLLDSLDYMIRRKET